jgi:hypothetical protein
MHAVADILEVVGMVFLFAMLMASILFYGWD